MNVLECWRVKMEDGRRGCWGRPCGRWMLKEVELKKMKLGTAIVARLRTRGAHFSFDVYTPS